MIEKSKIRIKTESGFNILHPETTIDQVLDSSGKSIAEVINKVSGDKKLTWIPHVINVVGVNQTRFEFTGPNFNPESSMVLVFKNGEFMNVDTEYIIDVSGANPAVVLSNGISTGSVAVIAAQETHVSEYDSGNINGNIFAVGSIDANTLDPAGFSQWLTDNGIVPTPEPEVPVVPPTWADGYQPTGKRYGIKINKTDSNPATRIEYILDAVGMTPAKMNYTTGLFEYGSWADVWFVKNNYPCMVTTAGVEGYKLNPNDYSKNLDGTLSTVADVNYSGNAMSKIPLVYVYQYEDTTHQYIILCDIKYDENYEAFAHTISDGTIKEYIYLSIYKSVAYTTSSNVPWSRSISNVNITNSLALVNDIANAKINGPRWDIRSWAHRSLINNLLNVIGKSDNGQETFGNGNSDLGAQLKTGTLDKMGQFMGYNSAFKQVKVFHMEGWWGDVCERIQGLINNRGTIKAKMVPPYNLTGAEFNDILTITSANTGFINQSISSKYGRVPKLLTGSSTTYQCDTSTITISDLYIAIVCGYHTSGSGAGPFCVILNNTGAGSNAIGAGLSCY